GVGVSFGADRIFDVLEELNLFPPSNLNQTKLLIINFDEAIASFTLPLLIKLREKNIPCELYPAAVKLKKQMSYADAKRIPYVLLVGEEEMNSGRLSLKNMLTGEQSNVTEEELIKILH
ncbi:MAG: His/Gly/Thr/Pro-type tRNA ligase C-terminal domain-containing protein, partial [Sphingobacterium sp.]